MMDITIKKNGEEYYIISIEHAVIDSIFDGRVPNGSDVYTVTIEQKENGAGPVKTLSGKLDFSLYKDEN